MRLLATTLTATALAAAGLAGAAQARSDVVRDGPARFEILSASLIRLEYAADGRFESRPTMTATRRRVGRPAFTTSIRNGWRVIRTSRLLLRYRLNSGPFSAGNLTLMLGHNRRVHPSAADDRAANLGGWRRALDLLSGPVALNPGLLSRAGWYVLDDTKTVLLTAGQPGFTTRPAHHGAYQDWYLFGYGHDYTRALRDLRTLTGPAPLLPRSAFGVWFSRYWPYSDQDYHVLLGQFRAQRVPLDTLSIDTDYKRESDPAGAAIAAAIAGAPGRPYSWDGWEWDPSLFPNPARFMRWAHANGVSVTLNIHPSMSSHDPQWPAVQAQTGGLKTSTGQCRILIADPTASCRVFDWTKPKQLAAYFALHRRFERDGADFFWFDWCCDDSSASAPGLTADTWINSRYGARERARGLRWLAFARVGGAYSASAPDDGDGINGGTGIFAEHRYTIQFTGDTCATWPMLAFEAQFTAEEGNVGLPYVSHDIGSFHGQPVPSGQCGPIGTSALTAHLPDDLYARWVQLGTFQPLDRLHSDHGDRLPWQYGAAADGAAGAFLRLREALNPYIYTLARRSYDTGLPMCGALYLQWPQLSAAYGHPSEYTFGRDVVVAPVTTSGDPAPVTVWVPPGTWFDLFTGRRYTGPSVRTLSVPVSRMPVLIRAGAVIPTQPYVPFTGAAAPKSLILTVYRGAGSRSVIYDDAGRGFGYTHGAFSLTRVVHVQRRHRYALTIGAARGHFAGAPAGRTWTVRFVSVRRPRRVEVNGRTVPATYDVATRTLTVRLRAIPTARATAISVSGG